MTKRPILHPAKGTVLPWRPIYDKPRVGRCQDIISDTAMSWEWARCGDKPVPVYRKRVWA